MYGTVAKLITKPGAIEEIRRMESGRRPSGYIGSYVFQSDQDANELWLVVIFESKEAYMANADSPEQEAEFRRLMNYLVTEPEWHDGEVVYSGK
ncbi:MAG: antibiotic biosynthesis monooxygenase [Deltaproteobacteria bacterium]|nr:antibiotic biosynthesis monooxygenase [Deltaproteobacteria bacterium]